LLLIQRDDAERGGVHRSKQLFKLIVERAL
jgi:hypothetical protein